MLKAEIKTFILLILLIESDMTWLVTYVLPVIAGLAIFTGQRLLNKTLTPRLVFVKLFFVAGLCLMVYIVYRAFNFSLDISITLFLVTFFSDAIVTEGQKAGEMGVRVYFSSLFNKNKYTENE